MEYKDYRIVGDGTFGNKLIQAKGSGQIPKALAGAYTSPSIAQAAIDRYILAQEEKNGKTKGTAKAPVRSK